MTKRLLQWIFIPLLGFLGGISALCIVLILVLSFCDLAMFRNEIANLTEKMAGYRLVIDGSLKIRPFNGRFMKVLLTDTKLFDSHDHARAKDEAVILELGELSGQLAWLPLLQGKVEVEGLKLRDIHYLQNIPSLSKTSADASNSNSPQFETIKRTDQASQSPDMFFSDFELRDIDIKQLSYQKNYLEKEASLNRNSPKFTVVNLQGQAHIHSNGWKVQSQGVLSGEDNKNHPLVEMIPVSVQGEGSNPWVLKNFQVPAHFHLEVLLDGNYLKLSKQAEDAALSHEEKKPIVMDLKAPQLQRALSYGLPDEKIVVPPISVQAQLSEYTLSKSIAANLHAQLGRSCFDGKLSLREPFDSPKLEVELTSSQIYWHDLQFIDQLRKSIILREPTLDKSTDASNDLKSDHATTAEKSMAFQQKADFSSLVPAWLLKTRLSLNLNLHFADDFPKSFPLKGVNAYAGLKDGRFFFAPLHLELRNKKALHAEFAIKLPTPALPKWQLDESTVSFGQSQLNAKADLRSDEQNDLSLTFEIWESTLKKNDLIDLYPPLKEKIRALQRGKGNASFVSIKEGSGAFAWNRDPLRLKARGQLLDLPYDLDVQGPSWLGLQSFFRDEGRLLSESDIPDASHIQLQVGRNKLKLSQLTFLPNSDGITANLDFHAPDLLNLSRGLGYPLAENPFIKAKALLRLKKGFYEASHLTFQVNKSVLTGETRYRGLAHHDWWEARLSSPLLRKKDFTALQLQKNSSPTNDNASKTATKAKGSTLAKSEQQENRLAQDKEESRARPKRPLKGHLILALQKYEGEGQAIPDFQNGQLDMRVDGTLLLVDAMQLNITNHPHKTFKAKGRIQLPIREGEGYAFNKVQVDYGKSIVRGDVLYNLNAKKPSFQIDVNSPYLSAEDFSEIFPETAKSLGVRDLQKKNPSKNSDEPDDDVTKDEKTSSKDQKWLLSQETDLPLDFLNNFDLVARLDLEDYRGELFGQALDDLHFQASILNGRLKLDQLRARLQEKGEFALTGELRKQKGIYHFEAASAFKNLQLGGLLQPHGEKEIKPLTPVKLIKAKLMGWGQLKSHGKTWRKMAENLNGDFEFTATNGYVNSALVEFLGIDITEGLTKMIGYTPPTDINCFIAKLEIEQGRLQPHDFVLATEDSNIVLEGHAYIPSGELNLDIKTYPRDVSVGSLRTPILIRGQLPQPKIRPKYANVVLKLGAALALGTFIHPLLALLPLVEPGPGSRYICQKFQADIEQIKWASQSRLDKDTMLAH